MTRPDDLLPLLAESGQPDTLFRALDRTFAELVGHQLFTLFYVDGQEVSRIYSNRPEHYPVAGRKLMGPTPWWKLVVEGRKPFLGVDKAGIRWAYFDHELIESMGLGSAINIPMIYNGETIGALSLLDAEHHYDQAAVDAVAPFAPLVIPAFLEARRAR